MMTQDETYEQKQARYSRWSRQYVRKFWGGYVECALWTSTDDADESGGEPLDSNYAVANIDPESFDQMQKECADFIFANRRDLKASGLSPERARGTISGSLVTDTAPASGMKGSAKWASG